MKLLKYDKKIWDNGETSHTWQFGVLKNLSFLWVYYENPTNHSYYSGGFHINLSFLQSDSLFGIEIITNNNQCLALHFFAEDFEGYEELK